MFFAKDQARSICVDVAAEALMLANKLFEKEKAEGEFIRADMAYLPIRNNTFDAVFAGGTIEHVKNTLTAVKEISRVLTHGGVFIATVPLISLSLIYYQFLTGSIPDIPVIRTIFEFVHLRALDKRFLKSGYEKSFTKRGIGKIFACANLSNAEIGPVHYPCPITLLRGRHTKNVLRKLVRHRPFWPMMYVKGVRR